MLGEDVEQRPVQVHGAHLDDEGGRGHRRVDAQRRLAGKRGEVLLRHGEYRAGGQRGDDGRQGRLQEIESLLPAQADAHALELARSRKVVGEKDRKRGGRHSQYGDADIPRKPKRRDERAQRQHALGDERLSYVVHAPMLLIGAMQDVNQQPHPLVQIEQGDGQQRMRGTREKRVRHAGDKRQPQRQTAEAEVLPQRVLMPDIGYLVGAHLVVGERTEDAHHRHGQRQKAGIIVSGREPHHEDGDEPLACQIGHRADGVPQHVRLRGKRWGRLPPLLVGDHRRYASHTCTSRALVGGGVRQSPYWISKNRS